MLSLSPATRVFLANRPIDGRKSFNALSVLVKETLQQEPTSGYLFVFINKARNRLKVLFDVSDPAAPVAVGSCAFTGEPRRLVVAGSHAYVCNSRSLQIIDVTQPSLPRRVGEFQVWQGADVAISGHYAYVAIETGLSVLDISNPANPFQVGTFRTQNEPYSVAVEGNIVYLGVRREGVHVLDVSNPAQPRELTFHDRHTSVLDLLIEGDYLYLADYTEGLQIIRVADPTQPEHVATVFVDGRVEGLTVANEHVYL